MSNKIALLRSVAAACLVGMVPSMAFAQTANTTATPPAGAAQEEAAIAASTNEAADRDDIIVTGVRGRPRTVTDSPTPIDVLNSADLERTGRAGVIQSLQTLIPSFNQPQRSGGGISAVISTGGLRGLNPDQTLVLVNGKRRHRTSLINAVSQVYNGSDPVDLDLIPQSSIARIEVLRDGAAAQYGSDAIAGVINVILKDSVGFSGTTSLGQNFDRSDGELVRFDGNYGIRLSDNGFLNLSASYKKQFISNRGVPIAATIQLYPRINGAPDPREATANRLITQNYGVLPQEGINIGYNMEYDAGNVEFYSFGSYSRRTSDLPFSYLAPNNVNTLPQVYPEGYRPIFSIYENDFQVAAGLRGELAGWSWDFSSTFGQNNARENSVDNLNPSLGPTSPTSFYLGTLKSSEWDNSLDVTRQYDLGSAGKLQVSFGLQHRLEHYKIVPGDEASYIVGPYVIPAGQPFAGQRPTPGAQYTPGFQPVNASSNFRNSGAVYGELGYNPTERLFIGAAVRAETYDDSSGSTAVWKVDGRYDLTPWLAFRGSAGTGFRAPTLAQQFFSSTASQFRIITGSALTLIQIRTLQVDSREAVALGAEPLTPEKSRNLSAGITLRPARNFDFTLDAYQIRLNDRIAITGTLTGTAISNILIANGLSGDLSAQYYTNAIDTRTRGIDAVATWRHDLGDYGNVRLNLAYNYNKTIITNIIANPPELTALGANFVLFDRLSQGYLTTALPLTKIVGGVNWDIGRFNVNARANRFGSYTIVQNVAANDRSFGAEWIFDLELGYKISDNIGVAVGSNNLFNNYPDANAIFNANLGQGQYPGISPIGYTGGFYYGRLSFKF